MYCHNPRSTSATRSYDRILEFDICIECRAMQMHVCVLLHEVVRDHKSAAGMSMIGVPRQRMTLAVCGRPLSSTGFEPVV